MNNTIQALNILKIILEVTKNTQLYNDAIVDLINTGGNSTAEDLALVLKGTAIAKAIRKYILNEYKDPTPHSNTAIEFADLIQARNAVIVDIKKIAAKLSLIVPNTSLAVAARKLQKTNHFNIVFEILIAIPATEIIPRASTATIATLSQELAISFAEIIPTAQIKTTIALLEQANDSETKETGILLEILKKAATQQNAYTIKHSVTDETLKKLNTIKEVACDYFKKIKDIRNAIAVPLIASEVNTAKSHIHFVLHKLSNLSHFIKKTSTNLNEYITNIFKKYGEVEQLTLDNHNKEGVVTFKKFNPENAKILLRINNLSRLKPMRLPIESESKEKKADEASIVCYQYKRDGIHAAKDEKLNIVLGKAIMFPKTRNRRQLSSLDFDYTKLIIAP